MTVYLRPIADVNNPGNWLTASLYSKLDEEVADGATTAITSSFVPDTTDYFTVKLTGGNPRTNKASDHILKIQAWEGLGSTDTEIRLELYANNILKLQEDITLTNGATPTIYEFTLSQTAVNLINSYSDLHVRVIPLARSGAVSIKVSWIEFEIPDPIPSITPQLLRPISDIINSGGWAIEPLWSKINEILPDDDTTKIISQVDPDSRNFHVQLTSVTEPTESSGFHIIKFRARDVSGNTDTVVRMHLYGGNIPIASQDVTLADGTNWATFESRLYQTEINLITDHSDYTDLRVRIIPVTSSSGAQIEITWIEVEVPQTESVTPSPLRVLVNTGFNVLLNTGHNLLLNAVSRIGVGIGNTHPTADLRGLGLGKPKKDIIYTLQANGKILRTIKSKANGRIQKTSTFVAKSRIIKTLQLTANSKIIRLHVKQAISQIFQRVESNKQGYKGQERTVRTLDELKRLDTKSRVKTLKELYKKYRDVEYI